MDDKTPATEIKIVKTDDVKKEVEAQEKVIQPSQIDSNDDSITEHRLEIHTYKLTRETLENIKKAAPSGQDELAWGIFLISTALNSIITISTATVSSNYMQIFFVVAIFVGFLLGGYFIKKWWSLRAEVSNIVNGVLKAPEKERRNI